MIVLSSLLKKIKIFRLNKFKLISNLTNKKIIALGGISKLNLKKLNLVKQIGFAGISFLSKKKAPKRALLIF